MTLDAIQTTGNRSSAVMQQRHEAHDSLDDFPTPPWAVRAFCDYLKQTEGLPLGRWTVREPAANRGYMARPLSEYFGEVLASDIHDYGAGYPIRDYLFGLDSDWPMVDWTITNPPFRLAQQFIERAIRTSRRGVAVIVRSAFVEGAARYENLFSQTPPSLILQHVERVPMVKGRYDPKASTATAYNWLVWTPNHTGRTAFDWIPPCRKMFEREGDVI